ncbi:MAG: hypothetical protein E6J69_11740 [Deltaproteobacteria bacterium]|nr:MAG: hypothetical protein E6J69_11740 [Deltaproteobacteria bacterium]
MLRQHLAVDADQLVHGGLPPRLGADPPRDGGRVGGVVAGELTREDLRRHRLAAHTHAEVEPAQAVEVLARHEWPDAVRVAEDDGGADGERLERRAALGEDDIVASEHLLGPRRGRP